MIRLDVWLYGPLSRFAGDGKTGAYAQVPIDLPDSATMSDLLDRLGMTTADKGLTFVNGRLTDMPGLAADLGTVLADGDRVAFFHERSMWPFQYRFGASISPELNEAMLKTEGGALHHSTPHASSRPASSTDNPEAGGK
jgi:hypothetical protein